MARDDKYILFVSLTVVAVVCVACLLASFTARADRVDNHYYPQEVPVINNYTTNVTEITEYSRLQDYDCNGVAIAMAGANNTMNFGTLKPQVSIGIGECNGELASSLMGGVRLSNNLFINGSWATDESVNSFGIGGTWVFK
jgi:hypothetical protein